MIALIPFSKIKALSLASYLSEEEAVRYQEIPKEKQPGFLASRYALKSVVGHYSTVDGGYLPWETIRLIKEGIQKPSLYVGTEKSIFDCAISHAHEMGGAIIAKHRGQRVGIDIETIRAFPDHILYAFMTKEERSRYEAEKDKMKKNIFATQLWTIKEAYLKAIGQGLRQHPSTVEVVVEPGGQFHVTDNGKPVHMQAGQTMIDNGYVISYGELMGDYYA